MPKNRAATYGKNTVKNNTIKHEAAIASFKKLNSWTLFEDKHAVVMTGRKAPIPAWKNVTQRFANCSAKRKETTVEGVVVRELSVTAIGVVADAAKSHKL